MQTPTVTSTLIPFETATPTATREPLGQVTLAEEDDLLPSPTPFVHQVQEGETLLSIALRYGVTLDGMLAANPGLDPRFLSIGQELRIPGPEGQPADTLLPTSTPLPLAISAGRCYRTVDEHWLCLAEVENTTDNPVEGLTAKVQFVDGDENLMGSSLAFAPLNRLAPGERLPLLADYDSEEVDELFAVFSLLSAVESSGEESRYLETTVEIESQDALSDDAESWQISGQLMVEADTSEAAYRISLLAMAVDAGGQIVGYTKWEPESTERSSWEFNISVFSLGPPIDRVDLAAEAIRLDQ